MLFSTTPEGREHISLNKLFFWLLSVIGESFRFSAYGETTFSQVFLLEALLLVMLPKFLGGVFF